MEEHNIAKEKGWKLGIDYPEWGNNKLYLQTIQGGYLVGNETPKQAYMRVAHSAATHLNKPELADKFFNIIWKGWLGLSTPVLSNMGTKRGLPISCFGSFVEDSLYEINRKIMEIAILSKSGGGTSANFSSVRPSGSIISGGGTSDGVIPFLKQLDSTVKASKQLPVRRGACAVYLDIEHKDYDDFLKIRKGQGDPDRQQMRLHQGAIIKDDFMNQMIAGDPEKRKLWGETLKWRIERGEPYLTFITNARNQAWWKNKLNIPDIENCQLCAEIFLPSDKDHTYVCCLSSLNLAKWDEYKDTDTIQLSIWFLDAVIQEFIEKAKEIKGIEDAVRFAEKSRAVGLGVLGLHTHLQSKMIPLESIQARSINKIIFKKIHEQTLIATKKLAEEYGEPEWLKDTGRRNLTLEAIAPTRSNSKLCGGISQGIEPVDANIYVDNDAKGSHVRKNDLLQKLLRSIGKDSAETWNSINAAKGSVQHLDFLTDEQKQVFKTFREINQMELVQQAADRQKYIEQGQSLNLAFAYDAPAKWVNQVHIKAWELGLKSLYYYRSQSVLNASNDLYQECISCEG